MVTRHEASQEISRLLPAVAVHLRLAALFDLEASDLTTNQVLALLVVAVSEGGRMKAGEIATRLGVSFPAATALVDRLVVAGALERAQGDDRRVVWISLTEAGNGIVARLRDGLESRIEFALSKTDAAEIQVLIDAVNQVASFVERMEYADPDRSAPSRSATSDRHPSPVSTEDPP
jgi:DNA-binding MarR family transcriptional regulator